MSDRRRELDARLDAAHAGLRAHQATPTAAGGNLTTAELLTLVELDEHRLEVLDRVARRQAAGRVG